jgi:hypothetical protein
MLKRIESNVDTSSVSKAHVKRRYLEIIIIETAGVCRPSGPQGFNPYAFITFSLCGVDYIYAKVELNNSSIPCTYPITYIMFPNSTSV